MRSTTKLIAKKLIDEHQRKVAATESCYKTLDEICDPCHYYDDQEESRSKLKALGSIICFLPGCFFKPVQACYNYNKTYANYSGPEGEPKYQYMS